jgi:hypothetical protein
MKKGRCCGLFSDKKAYDKNQKKVGMLERQVMEQNATKKSVERTKKILREDIYQNLTKMYFQLGYDYKDFTRMFFEKNYYEAEMQDQGEV